MINAINANSSDISNPTAAPVSMDVTFPDDYLERVYAGVLGKLIGVYLGRPFEGWTHQKIMSVLGPVRYYVHDHPKMPASPFNPSLGLAVDHGLPLVVTDDDISGTFVFLRALEEHMLADGHIITSEQIGKTWLNQIIDGQTILWWGGRGVSTEHTAFLNLQDGVPAPRSGAIATNGKTVAEQIGAQIFIDGWAMVAPGQPQLAARLAREAGSVSHDGESVYAAMLWAAMEAEAFVSRDVDHLLDTGLSVIPRDSAIAALVADLRAWHAADIGGGGDWLATRQKLENRYGYDKYCGVCHVMPNHGVMILALLYGGHDFTEAMHIVNTCGWDTDCNSGNIGCLVALIHGLDAFRSADWRGPVQDRALISSADGGFSIANAANLALDVANLGRRVGGLPVLPPPKDGAQFHFTFPGSVQGFRSTSADTALVAQEIDENGTGVLAISPKGGSTTASSWETVVLTDSFMDKDVLKMPTYPLMASPLVYPGQTLKAILRVSTDASSAVQAALHLRAYAPGDEFVDRASQSITIQPGEERTMEWTIPDDLDSQPIQAIGIKLTAAQAQFHGKALLDRLSWTGTPNYILTKPSSSSSQRPGQFWARAWVKAVDNFLPWRGPPFTIVKNRGEGIIIQGTRDWKDYRITVSNFTVQLGNPAGIAIRVRGLNRYYALLLTENRTKVALVKALDEKRIVLASAALSWELDTPCKLVLEATDAKIRGKVEGTSIELVADDDQYKGGGLGLVVTNGTVAAGPIRVEPV